MGGDVKGQAVVLEFARVHCGGRLGHWLIVQQAVAHGNSTLLALCAASFLHQCGPACNSAISHSSFSHPLPPPARSVNRFNSFEGWVGSESVGQDILISGRIDMNRAMEGDVVAGKFCCV